MSSLLTPLPAQPAQAPGSATPPAALTARTFLVGYARILLVPLAALAALLTGWTLAQGTGRPAAVAAAAGWSVAVAAWLRRSGWRTARAQLLVWAAPAALLAPLAGLGRLSADGLVLWGPVSAVLAVALTAVHDPELVSRPAPGSPDLGSLAAGRPEPFRPPTSYRPVPRPVAEPFRSTP